MFDGIRPGQLPQVIEIAEHLFLGAPDRIAERIESILVDQNKDEERIHQRWLSSHLPAYLLGPAQRYFPDRKTILMACLDGVERALRQLSGIPDVSYDDLWICLEVLEEIAGQITHDPKTKDIFVRRYVSMCLGSESTIVPAALAWGVNEFLERGPASAALGLEIALKLMEYGPNEARYVVSIMSEGNRVLRAAMSTHAEFAVPLPTDTVDLLNRIRTEQTRLIACLKASSSVSFRIDVEPVLSKVLESCVLHAGSDRGIACLAGLKSLLKELCATLNEFQDETAISDLCGFILNVANRERPEIPVFLVIEASEAVRDAYGEIFASAMGTFLGQARPLLAQGIAVCVSEGYESASAEDCQSAPRFFDRSVPLGRSTRGALNRRPSKGLGGFFDKARTSVKERSDLAPLGHWVDQRLELLAAQSLT